MMHLRRAALGFVPWRKLPACEIAENGKLEAYPTGKFSSAARLKGWILLIGAMCLAVLGLPAASPAFSEDSPSPPVERKEAPPQDLLEVGVTEHLGEQIPLDLQFEDTAEKEVTLRDFFDGNRPVILTMNYSNCPMLCSLQMNGLFAGLKEMELSLGEKFQMITVSIDPLETNARASLTKRNYMKQYGRAGSAPAYHCLVGDEQNIRALADAVGFRYKFLREKNEYAHAAVTMILTPDGEISRYLYGVKYDPQTLKLALLEASEGKIGTTIDQVLLFCYQYDAASGTYAPAAVVIMQLAAGLAIVVVGAVLIAFWRRESRRRRQSVASDVSAHPTQPSPT